MARRPRPAASLLAAALSLLAAVVLAAFFVVDYPAARGVYAVAAGMHAWLEWPVLLMAWLGGSALLAQRGEGLQRSHA